MNEKIMQIAERIKGLRELLGISEQEMGQTLQLTPGRPA